MTKPKLVIVTPGVPDKNGKGYQVLLYHRIQSLSSNHDIKIYVPYFFWGSYKQNIDVNGISYEYFKVTLVDFIRNILRVMFFGFPIQTAFFTSSSLQKVLRGVQPNWYLCILSRTYLNFRHVNKDKIVIDFVDSMYLNFIRRKNKSKLLSKFIYNLEAIKCSRFENQIAESVMTSFAVSSIDASLISDTVNTLPLGVDLFTHDDKRLNNICFSGNMNYAPNIEAIVWFYKSVWLVYKDRLAGIKLKVIGRNPPVILQQLFENDDSVILTGEVDDLQFELSRCLVSIAPMQSGSGMQFKILEAMAVGTPVISTTLGVGDIKARDGIDILIADEAIEFFENIKNLVYDANRRQRLGQAAKDFIEAEHNWEKINIKYQDIIMRSLD